MKAENKNKSYSEILLDMKQKDDARKKGGRKVLRSVFSIFLCLILVASVCIPVIDAILNATTARANDQALGQSTQGFGQVAHTHGRDCYFEEFVLTCGVYEGYGEVSEYLAGYAHSDGCQTWCVDTESMVLICLLQESGGQSVVLSQGHVHGNRCFEFFTNLVCGMTESTGDSGAEAGMTGENEFGEGEFGFGEFGAFGFEPMSGELFTLTFMTYTSGNNVNDHRTFTHEYMEIDFVSHITANLIPDYNPPAPSGYRFIDWFAEVPNTNPNIRVLEEFPLDLREPIALTENTNLYAVFADVEKRFVYFENGQGLVIHSQEVEIGGTIADPGTAVTNQIAVGPDRLLWDGRLDNWSVRGGGAFTFGSTPVTEDVSLVPNRVNGFFVFYETSGGTFIPPELVRPGARATQPAPNPTRDQFDFVHWSDTHEGTNGVYYFTDPVTRDMTLHAQWIGQIVGYTIVYWFERPGLRNELTPAQIANPNTYEFGFTTTHTARAGSHVTVSAATADSLLNNVATSSGSNVSIARDIRDFGVFNRSETRTIAADGTTLINVYYTRFVFEFRITLNFPTGTNASNHTVYATFRYPLDVPTNQTHQRWHCCHNGRLDLRMKLGAPQSGPELVSRDITLHRNSDWLEHNTWRATGYNSINFDTGRYTRLQSLITDWQGSSVARTTAFPRRLDLHWVQNPANYDIGYFVEIFDGQTYFANSSQFTELVQKTTNPYRVANSVTGLSSGYTNLVGTVHFMEDTSRRHDLLINPGIRSFGSTGDIFSDGGLLVSDAFHPTSGSFNRMRRIRQEGVWTGVNTANDTNVTVTRDNPYMGFQLRRRFTLTYNTRGGSTVPSAQSIQTGFPLGGQRLGLQWDTPPTSFERTSTREGFQFMGWYHDADYFRRVNWNTLTMPPTNLTVFARWEPLNRNVRFFNSRADIEAGVEPLLSVAPNARGTISDPGIYERGFLHMEHGVFDGWVIDGQQLGMTVPFPFNSMNLSHLQPNENFDIYASWRSAGFTVTYNRGAGTGTPPTDNNTYNVNAPVIVRPTTGLTFSGRNAIGWTLNGGSEIYLPGSVIPARGDMVFTADFTVSNTALAFHRNRNASDTDHFDWNVASGRSYFLPGAEHLGFTNPGHRFLGWHTTDRNATTPSHLAGQSILVSSNMNFFAVWERTHWVVTFDSAGGSEVPSQFVPTAGGTATRPADPTRDGYTFVDWFQGSSANPYDFSTSVTGDITLTARWIPTTGADLVKSLANVTYPSNGTDPINIRYNISYTLPTNINNVENVTIVDSYDSRLNLIENGVSLTLGGVPMNMAGILVETNTLLNQVRIVVPDNRFTASDVGSTLTATLSFRADAGITGTISNNSSVQINGRSIDPQNPNDPKVDLHVVLFNANGGEFQNGSEKRTQIVEHGKPATAPTPNPTRPGFDFDGWNGDLSSITAPVEILAIWDAIDYTIAYDLQGGTVASNPTSYNANILPLQINDPVRTGFVFGGWEVEDDQGNSFADIPVGGSIQKGTVGNLTLTAKWTFGDFEHPHPDDFTKVSTSSAKEYVPGTPVAYDVSLRLPSDVDGYAAIRLEDSFDVTRVASPRLVSLTINGAAVSPMPSLNTSVAGMVSVTITRATQNGYVFNANDLIVARFEFDVLANVSGDIVNNARLVIVPLEGNETGSVGDTETVTLRKYDVSFNPGTQGMIPGLSMGASAVRYIEHDTAIGNDMPLDPSRSSYTFTGWFEANGTEVTDSTVVTGDISAEARWIYTGATKLEKELASISYPDTAPGEVHIHYTISYTLPENVHLAKDVVVIDEHDSKLSLIGGGVAITVGGVPMDMFGVSYGSVTAQGPVRIVIPGSKFVASDAGKDLVVTIRFRANDTIDGTIQNNAKVHINGTEVDPRNPDEPKVTLHVVSFDANEGEFADGTDVKTQIVEHGKAAVAPTPNPTRMGYEFNGWDRAFDTITAPTTVSAVWTFNTVVHPEPGDFTKIYDGTNKEYVPGDTISYTLSLKLPSDVDGYEGIRFEDSFDATKVENPTLLSVTVNGSAVSPMPVLDASVSGMVSFTLPRAEFNANNTIVATMSFDVKATATGSIVNNARLVVIPLEGGEEPSVGDTETITLKKYDVVFDPGAEGNFPGRAKGETITEDVEHGYAIGSKMPSDPIRLGYDFKGWEDTNGNAVTSDTIVTDTLDAYAVWELVTYTIGYDLRGGANASGNPTSYDITRLPLGIGNATRSGYEFTGWDVTGSVGNTLNFIPVDGSIPSNTTGNLTLSARWDLNVYDVSFNPGPNATIPGLGMGESADRRVGHGNNIGYQMPENPTRDGYTFVGWFDGDDAVTASTIVTDDINAEARWVQTGGTKFVKEFAGLEYPATDPGRVHISYSITYRLPENIHLVRDVVIIDEHDSRLSLVGGSASLTLGGVTVDMSGITVVADNGQVAITIPGSRFTTADIGKDLVATFIFRADAGITGTIVNNARVLVNGAEVEPNDPDDPKVQLHVVTFDANEGSFADGTDLKTQIVEHGKAAAAPTPNPTRTGYNFIGWDRSFAVITAPVTVKAVWTFGDLEHPHPDDFTKTSNAAHGVYIPGTEISYDISLKLPTDIDGYKGIRLEDSHPAELLSPRLTGFTVNGTAVTPRPVLNTSVPGKVSLSLGMDGFNGGDVIVATVTFNISTSARGDIINNARLIIIPLEGDEVPSVGDEERVLREEYEVIFNPGPEGTIPGKDKGETVTEDIKHGDEIGDKMPADPTRPGYDFGGWEDQNGDPVDKDTVVTEELEVIARWNVVNYTISYTLNGGTNATGNPTSYNVEILPLSIGNPSRTGFTFSGWTVTGSVGNTLTSIPVSGSVPAGTMGNLTLEANWSIVSYNVSFDPGAMGTIPGLGRGQEAVRDVAHGTAIGNQMPSNPTRNGYVFAGWYDADGNVVNASTVVTSPIDTVARWISSGNAELNKDFAELVHPGSDTGRVHLRYSITYTLPENIHLAENLIIVDDHDSKLSLIGGSVSITLGGTAMNMSGISVTATGGMVRIVIPGDRFIAADAGKDIEVTLRFRADDTVTGTITNDARVYLDNGDGEKPVDPRDPDDTKVILHTVRFVDWDHTLLKLEMVRNGESATAPAVPVHRGMTFTGWDNAFDNVTEGITVRATYSPTPFIITYDVGEGTNAENNPTMYNGNILPLAILDPTREGWTFTGWTVTGSEGNSLTSLPVSGSIPAGTTGDLLLTALWTQVTHTVIFADWNGNVLKTESVPHGNNATAPADPVRSGHTFTGWDRSFTNVQGDLTVTAQYALVPVETPPPTIIINNPPPVIINNPPPVIINNPPPVVVNNPPPVIVNNPPADTPAPPVVAGEGTVITHIDRPPQEEPPREVYIVSDEVPLQPEFYGRNGNSWSLLNLILAVAGAMLAVQTIIRAIMFVVRKRRESADEYHEVSNSETRAKFRLPWFIGVLLAAVTGVVLFIVLENTDFRMVIVNLWTILYAALFTVVCVSMEFTFRKARDNGEQDAEDSKGMSDATAVTKA